MCQICGAADETIQYDHKIPLLRNGPTVLDNLQLLCRACNVEKRAACRHCALPLCAGCPYATPAQFGGRLAVLLDHALLEKLRAEAASRNLPAQTLLAELLRSRYSTGD